MTKDEALNLALEVFESMTQDSIFYGEFDDEIAAIKEALAQPTSGDYAFGYFEKAQQAHDVYFKFLGETYGQFAQ